MLGVGLSNVGYQLVTMAYLALNESKDLKPACDGCFFHMFDAQTWISSYLHAIFSLSPKATGDEYLEEATCDLARDLGVFGMFGVRALSGKDDVITSKRSETQRTAPFWTSKRFPSRPFRCAW